MLNTYDPYISYYGHLVNWLELSREVDRGRFQEGCKPVVAEQKFETYDTRQTELEEESWRSLGWIGL